MKALITGITGQDASYLAELLLSKDYEVHGTFRRTSRLNMQNIKGCIKDLILHSATMENYGSIWKVINKVKPDEIYHLAAQSFVTNSFEDEFSTMQSNINGTHYVLNSMKEIVPKSKLYFAGTSEMFGNMPEPQDEYTPMQPVSPYGISKLACYNLCKYYREAFKLFICVGILFNHESPRRGDEFVTKKIINAVKNKEKVKLGNLGARRDWGYAKEYVQAMHLMLQQPTPEDYVIATGVTRTVGEFAELAYRTAGLNWQEYVEVDPNFYRPNELHTLRGDSRKAETFLGWRAKTDVPKLVEVMLNE